MTKTRRRSRALPPELLFKVQQLAVAGYTAPAIHEQLPVDDRPTVRTIYRMVEDFMPPDPSGTWSPLQSADPSPSLVLPVLASVVLGTGGRRVTLTNAEAKLIERIREAVTDLSSWNIYVLARAYMVCDSEEEDSRPLDMVLAFAPWRSVEHSERYFGALNDGWVQWPNLFVLQFAASAAVATNPKGNPSKRVPETWAYCQRLFSAVKGADQVTPKDVEWVLKVGAYAGNVRVIPNPYRRPSNNEAETKGQVNHDTQS